MSTVFEQEIRSQGALLAARAVSGLEQARLVGESWRDVQYALVAARGSSDNAAVFFQYLAGQELGLLVSLAAPSLYEVPETMRLRGAGVLAISQSGRTPGLVHVIQSAHTQGCPSAAMTNDVASPLALASDLVIELGAGPERAIASTKTFSTAWHALAQLVEVLKGSRLDGLTELPAMVERVADWALATELPTDLLDVGGGLTIVGRGVGQAVAAEVSLKLREVTGVRAESYSAADYLHGPIGADGAGSTLVVVVTDEMSDAIRDELLAESRRFGMRTVAMRAVARSTAAADAEVVIDESLPNWCLGLAQVLVGQVLALRLGQARGRPIDTAPGLNKVTLSA